MYILGVSFGFHDSAAALIREGEVVAAAQQERFSRNKNDAGFPGDAIAFCLDQAGIKGQQLDLVAYYEEPLTKFDRIVEASIRSYPSTARYLDDVVARWHKDGQFDVTGRLARHLGIAPSRVVETRHHDSHAASAFFCSPFESAAVVTLDGVGEYQTAQISLGEGGGLTPLASINLPHSLGLFYSAFTAYLGFPVNEGEYKVMGMAAFGTPRWKDRLLALFELLPDGRFTLDQALFAFNPPEDLPYTLLLVEAFGPARPPGAPFALGDDSMPSEVPVDQRAEVIRQSRHFADIAASVQACTEEVILHVVRAAAKRTGKRQVCLAGGVALNSLANGRILRETGLDLFVQPAAGDAGGALGAAAYHWHQTLGGSRMAPLRTAALGRAFTRQRVDEALESSGFDLEYSGDDEDDWLAAVADLIAKGSVVGWFHGRAEWGPRALGNRSILANPRSASMRRRVNEIIKFREPFRPFAPAVAAERAAEFFEFPGAATPGRPEDFMLAVHSVRPEWKTKLAAVTHADGTARLQLVHADGDPVFHKLLRQIDARTGLPVVLNTSFNLNGEPIVDTPEDALRTFTLSGLDYLCIENRILSKRLVL